MVTEIKRASAIDEKDDAANLRQESFIGSSFG